MTIEELKEIIARNEGETIEFKESTGQRVDACETLCAFLNRDGGVIVFGVSRKGKLTGQLVADTTKRDLFEAFQKFEPAADVEVEWVPIDETQTIETWGRGLTRIAAECQRVGLPLPTTTTEHGNVLTVFQRPGWTRTGTVAEISGTTNPRTGTRWVVLVSDPVAHLPSLRKDARANAEAVLHEIIADNAATIPEICARTGMALRTINNAIATLRTAGIVQSGDFKTGLKEGVKSRANGEDDGVNDGVNDVVNDGVNLTSVEAKAVQALLRDRRLSAVRLAEHLGVKPRQAQRIIAKLKIKAGLTRRGTDKNGEWYFDGDVL